MALSLNDSNILIITFIILLAAVMIIQGSIGIADYNKKKGTQDATAETLYKAQAGLLGIGVVAFVLALAFAVYKYKEQVPNLPKATIDNVELPRTTIDNVELGGVMM